MDLAIETKVQSELGKVREKATQEAETKARLPLLEKEQQISAMQQQIEERDAKLAAAQKGGNDTYALLGSDLDHEAISAIVQVTRKKGKDVRLLWDLMKLFHHCSYLSLGPERGTDETVAVADVKWLFETQGREGATIVSPSWPIPAKGSKENKDTQPPHRQAANHHRRVVKKLSGHFTVTMEEPSTTRPRPFGFEITAFGIALIVAAPMVSTYAAAATPRAG